MFVIADIAGFQEKLTQGMKVKVPLQEADTGTTVRFDRILLVCDGAAITVGKPYVEGAAVEVKVLTHGKGDKIRVQKATRRKRYRRVKGHRQAFTEVEVVKIVR